MDKDMQPEMTTDSEGNKRWQLDGKFHREDGPAIEYADGYTSWWLYDEIHRTDGPAVEDTNGEKQWYLYDIKLTFDKWLAKTTGLTEEEKVMMKLKYG
jgi:hypothetical protein